MTSIQKSKGFSLIELLIAVGILSIIIGGMTTYMVSQQREVKSLTETLAKLDVEKFLIAALADGNVCSSELTAPALNPSAPYTINATNSTTLAATSISLNELHSGNLPTSPILIRRGQSPSPMTNSLLIDDIRFGNLQATGVSNQYLAQFTISFSGNLIRPLAPLILQKTITLNGADPIANRRITGCLGATPSPTGGAPAVNSGLPGSYCAPYTYCGRNSGIALCMSRECHDCRTVTTQVREAARIFYGPVNYSVNHYYPVSNSSSPCSAGLYWQN